jgi:protein-S-isoprenylcysteine O-methyltransferase Ste14
MISSVAILSAYFLVWAVVHSLLASLRVKDWARQTLGAGVDRWYRLAYVVFATATSLPIFAMGALLPDRTLYVVPTPWRWLMIGGQMAALAGAAGAVLRTGPSYFLGLSQLLARRSTDDTLQVQGFYCYVRHPLYLFAILFVWLTPAMTVNMATLYGLITLYFAVGSVHEERRLVAQFGAAYRAYQRQVPRLIPRPGRCYATAKEMAPDDSTDGRVWRIKQGKQE